MFDNIWRFSRDLLFSKITVIEAVLTIFANVQWFLYFFLTLGLGHCKTMGLWENRSTQYTSVHSQIYKYSRNNSVVYLLLLLTIQTSAVQTEWHPELRSEPKTFEAFLILTGARGIIKMEAHGTIHMELEIQETFKEYLFAGEGWVEAQLKGLH